MFIYLFWNLKDNFSIKDYFESDDEYHQQSFGAIHKNESQVHKLQNDKQKIFFLYFLAK